MAKCLIISQSQLEAWSSPCVYIFRKRGIAVKAFMTEQAFITKPSWGARRNYFTKK